MIICVLDKTALTWPGLQIEEAFCCIIYVDTVIYNRRKKNKRFPEPS